MTVHTPFYQLDILGDRIIANGAHVATLEPARAGDIGTRIQFEEYLRGDEFADLASENAGLRDEVSDLEDAPVLAVNAFRDVIGALQTEAGDADTLEELRDLLAGRIEKMQEILDDAE